MEQQKPSVAGVSDGRGPGEAGEMGGEGSEQAGFPLYTASHGQAWGSGDRIQWRSEMSMHD